MDRETIKRARPSVNLLCLQEQSGIARDIEALCSFAERHMEAPADRTAELHAEVDRLDRLAGFKAEPKGCPTPGACMCPGYENVPVEPSADYLEKED